MQNVRENRHRLGILAVVALILLLVLGVSCSKQEESPQEILDRLEINFSNEAYTAKHSHGSVIGISEATKHNFESFHPTVLETVEIAHIEGIEAEYRKIWDVLSESQDEKELAEIYYGLMTSWLTNPELLISLFNRDLSDESYDRQAAASFMLAMAFAHGDFSGAVLSEDEYKEYNDKTNRQRRDELQKVINEKYDQLQSYGLEKLKECYEAYPDSLVAILARIDYAGQLGKKGGDCFGVEKVNYEIIESKYPGTEFETIGLFFLFTAYKNQGNVEKAVQYGELALERPDVMAITGYTIHDLIEEGLREIANNRN